MRPFLSVIADDPDLIPSEATWWPYGHDLFEVQIGDGLKRLPGRGVAGGFRKRLEPTRIFGLEAGEPGDGVIPTP
jgi:hypothetical protein